MRSDWRRVKAADFIDFNPREDLKKGEMAKKVAMDQLQPFTRDIVGFELSPFNGGSKFRNDDTLLARITPCLENGKTAKVNILDDGEVGFGSTEFIVLRARPGISDSEFIYYLAMSPILRDIAIKSMVGSSGRQRVQQGVLNDIKFLSPPLAEQIEIGRTLSAFDDKIENNRKINARLEAVAQAIFKSWFVDFEPWGGVMPEGWREGGLGEIIDLFDYKRIPLSNKQRAKMAKIYPYYGAASLMDYVDNYLFDGIYLLLGEDGTVTDDLGFPTLQYVWGKFWVNNHAHVLQGRNGFTVESLYTLLKQTNVTSIITGAVQPKINQANLRSLEIIIPPKEAIAQFSTMIDPLFAQIRRNSDENRHLATLRDTLLPRLMSGELPVAAAA